MVFSSIIFTFVFLPIVIFLYYISADRYKNLLLLVASLLFYAIGEPKAVLLMVCSIAFNYTIGILIDRCKLSAYRKVLLILCVAVNLGSLFYYKYLSYLFSLTNTYVGTQFKELNIVLPIGISFFTFQAMSYVIDVYKKKTAVEKNILNVGLYISFFPQLIAGPIVRYSTISEQISNRYVNIDKFGEGTRRFIIGFSKKLILANNLSIIAEYAFSYENLHEMPVALGWLGSIAFSMQIFYDFSGYSDMAIGLGKMFGFDLQENFNYPYIANSVTDFWHRWHISLSQWFRDYVYIPLGGSRKGVAVQIRNLLVVWVLTGIWHGANVTFLLWGCIFFVALIFEKFILKIEKRRITIRIGWQIVTLLIVNIAWILFNMEDLSRTVMFMKAMAGMYKNAILDYSVIRLAREYGAFIVFGVLFSTPIIPKIEKIVKNKGRLKTVYECGYIMISVFLFMWSVSYLILGAHNPFIYFNF